MPELNRCYEILGLKVGALPAEVKQAYRELAKLWHPDRFSDPQQKLRAEEEIKQINQAYQSLKFHQPDLLTSPASGATPEAVTPEHSAAPARSAPSTRIYASGASAVEAFYNAGAEHVKGGRYHEAIENFSSAIKLSSTYAEAYRYRGFVYSLMGLELGAAADLKRAEELGLRRQKTPTSGTSSRPASPAPAAESPIPFAPEHWVCRYTLAEHTSPVSSVAISRDGKLLVSASWDYTIALWNLRAGKLLGRLSDHTAPVLAIALSPDGQLLASGSADCTIKLWYLRTGTLLKTLTGHCGAVHALAFSPDRQAQTLLSASQDGTVKLWQPSSGKLMGTLGSQQLAIAAIALRPDGRQLAVASTTSASASSNASVSLWHLGSGHVSHTLAEAARAIAFSPNGRLLALSCPDQTVKLWDLQTFTLLNTFGYKAGGYTDRGSAIAFSPSGHALATGSPEGSVTLWHWASGQMLGQLTGHPETIHALAYSQDGQTLVSGSADQTVKIWHRR